MVGLLFTLHIFLCVFLVIIILLQPATKGSGFASSLSGSCTSNSVFGARGPVPLLVKITYWLAIFLTITSLALEIKTIKRGISVLDRNVTLVIPSVIHKNKSSDILSIKERSVSACIKDLIIRSNVYF